MVVVELVSDWHEGWGIPNKGRIFKLSDPSKTDDATVKEVKQLLADGFTQRSNEELAKLLEHKDKRVRQESQFALAEKKATETLAKARSTIARGKQPPNLADWIFAKETLLLEHLIAIEPAVA